MNWSQKLIYKHFFREINQFQENSEEKREIHSHRKIFREINRLVISLVKGLLSSFTCGLLHTVIPLGLTFEFTKNS